MLEDFCRDADEGGQVVETPVKGSCCVNLGLYVAVLRSRKVEQACLPRWKWLCSLSKVTLLGCTEVAWTLVVAFADSQNV